MAAVCLRNLTADERTTVQKLAHSRTAPAHRVQRAQIIWRASRGESASAIAARVGLDGETVRKRIRRFNAEGLEALKDRHRSGRRPTYSAEQTATVIASALTKPQTLGLPFAAWTLDRLAAYLHEHKLKAVTEATFLVDLSGASGRLRGIMAFSSDLLVEAAHGTGLLTGHDCC